MHGNFAWPDIRACTHWTCPGPCVVIVASVSQSQISNSDDCLASRKHALVSDAFTLQDTATTCRERCGGQGYLSCNRFGQILGFAHAGMTAEGDNRVLMMKVSKEYLASVHLPSTKARLRAGSSSSPISGKPLLISAQTSSRGCIPRFQSSLAWQCIPTITLC